MSRELDKILSMLKTVEDPATAVFDLADETAQGFMVITKELEELNWKIDEAIANRIDGVDGEKGDRGEKGEKGDPGKDGKDGMNGLNGLDGKDGKDGVNGIDGLNGKDGLDGEMGQMPKHEWKGTKIRFEESPGKWGKWVDLQGETGRALFGGGGSHVQVSDATGLITDNVQTLDFRTGIQVAQVGMNTRITVTGSGVDHGLLSGLSDDDHTQYHTDARALAWLNTRSISDLGTKDHDLLSGLTDDDHTQYLLLVGRSGGQTAYGGTDAGDNLILGSTSNATKGYIQLGETLQILKNGTFTNAIGVISWGRSSLYEQTGGVPRFFFKPSGDRFEVLSEDGNTFLLSVRGANASPANTTYFGTALSIGSGYIGGALPSNGLIVQGYTGHGRLMTVEPPQAMLHIRQYQADEVTRFEGRTDYGYNAYHTYVRGTNAQRGTIGYDDASETLITGSLANAFFVNGITALTLAQNSVAIVNINSTDVVVKRTMTTEQGRVQQINTTAKTANYTVLSTDDNVLCDTSGGAFTITLPASPVDGEVHTIILDAIGGGDLTVDGNGNNINGEATKTMGSVGAAQFIYNGTQWNIK